MSPEASDAVQICTLVALFLRDVTLNDLSVHDTHAACVYRQDDFYYAMGFLADGLLLVMMKSLCRLAGGGRVGRCATATRGCIS
jgi:hypothetical protein